MLHIDYIILCKKLSFFFINFFVLNKIRELILRNQEVFLYIKEKGTLKSIYNLSSLKFYLNEHFLAFLSIQLI